MQIGLFTNDDLPYEYQTRRDDLDVPTLPEMTAKAIEVLERGSDGPNGYFLMVNY